MLAGNDREYQRCLEGPFTNDGDGGCPDNGRLLDVVRVTLLRSRRSGWYQVPDLKVREGDRVVVEAERGSAMGQVNSQPRSLWFKDDSQPPRVIRLVTSEKDRAPSDLQRIEADMRRVCAELAVQKKLVFKVVDAEYLYWENRVIFYFVSEGRVDFRELVKDLSREVRCRVEMRQIGPRDETRLLGGIGTCGREHCCASFLTQFDSIRIKMVKDQGLVLNPQKVSGGCGKLKCCLAYEVEVYRRLKTEMPPLGSMVTVPDGRVGRVYEVDVMGRKVGLVFTDGETSHRGTFPVAQLKDDTGKSLARDEDKVKDEGIGTEYLIATGKRHLPMMPLEGEDGDEVGTEAEASSGLSSGDGLRRRRPSETSAVPRSGESRERPGSRPRRPRKDGPAREGAPREGAPRDGAGRGGAPRGGAPRDGAPRDGAPAKEGGQGERGDRDRTPRDRGPREGRRDQGQRSRGGSDQRQRQGQRPPRQDGAKPDGAKPEGGKPEGARPEGGRPEGQRGDGARPEGQGQRRGRDRRDGRSAPRPAEGGEGPKPAGGSEGPKES